MILNLSYDTPVENSVEEFAIFFIQFLYPTVEVIKLSIL